MNKEEAKKIHRRITLLTLAALVVVLAILVAGIVMGNLNVVLFQILASLYLAAYWAVTDILEPKLTKELEGVTQAQKENHRKYVAVSGLGYFGIILFILTANTSGSSTFGMLGIIVYALTMGQKRRLRTEFLHPEKKEEAREEEEEE